MNKTVESSVSMEHEPASSHSSIHSGEKTSGMELAEMSPNKSIGEEGKCPAFTEDMRTTVAKKTCKCDASCSCRDPLEFPRRVGNLPPVKAILGLYEGIKTSNALFNCMFTSAEVAALVATIPARLAAKPLRDTLATPVYVADIVLCKGLDLAERVLPCLKQDPSKTFRNVAFCACGVPAGMCYLSTKLACKGLRTCLCDIPAVACGVPALTCCSAAEICFCDIPCSAFYLPARVATTAVHGVMKDAEDVIKDVNAASGRCMAQWRQNAEGCE